MYKYLMPHGQCRGKKKYQPTQVIQPALSPAQVLPGSISLCYHPFHHGYQSSCTSCCGPGYLRHCKPCAQCQPRGRHSPGTPADHHLRRPEERRLQARGVYLCPWFYRDRQHGTYNSPHVPSIVRKQTHPSNVTLLTN